MAFADYGVWRLLIGFFVLAKTDVWIQWVQFQSNEDSLVPLEPAQSAGDRQTPLRADNDHLQWNCWKCYRVKIKRCNPWMYLV